jgi:hypothetical protein
MDGMTEKYNLLLIELAKRDTALAMLLVSTLVIVGCFILLDYDWLAPKRIRTWMKSLFRIGGLVMYLFILWLSFFG